MLTKVNIKKEWIEAVDKVFDDNNRDPSNLIAIMQDIQRVLGYLPKEILEKTADDLNIPLSRVYAVATFYKAFKLKPQGKHIIKVCLGTACHIKGGPLIMDALKKELEVEPEDISKDGLFSYEAVRCVGCCGLAPVIMVDEDFHGKLKPKEIKKILKQYS